MATYHSDNILILFFSDTTKVGFYSLAVTFASPMFMLSGSLSTALFKDFAHTKKIPKRVIYINFLWLLSCCIGIVTLGKYVVPLLSSEKFLKSLPILNILAFANFFRGMTQPYNRFLGANGQGKALRNSALVLTVCNLLGNLTLIPMYAAIGAAYASLFALMANFFSHVFFYRKYVKLHMI